MSCCFHGSYLPGCCTGDAHPGYYCAAGWGCRCHRPGYSWNFAACKVCSDNSVRWAFIDDMIGSSVGSGGCCWGHRRKNSYAGGCSVLEVYN